MLDIKPLRDKILVERDAGDEMTSGGLYLPDGAKEKHKQFATVLAVGPGKTDQKGNFIPNTLQPGQRVVIGKYTGTHLKELENNLFLVSESEVLAVLE